MAAILADLLSNVAAKVSATDTADSFLLPWQCSAVQCIIARQSSGGWPADLAGRVTLANIDLVLSGYNASVTQPPRGTSYKIVNLALSVGLYWKILFSSSRVT